MISSTIEGIIASSFSPLIMTVGFFIWDDKWGGVGGSAFALNLYKCTTASLGFMIMSFICGFTTATTTFNSSSSSTAAAAAAAFSTRNVGYLILSSTLGIIIGDVLWLQALLILGAKQVIVIDSLRPFCAAILGRLILNETLGLAAWGGMVLTVGGVVIVAIEDGRRRMTTTTTTKMTTTTTMTVSMGNVDSVVRRKNGVAMMADDANEKYFVNKKEDVEQQESSTSAINNDDKGLDVNVDIATRTRTDETARTIITDRNSTVYSNNDDDENQNDNESSESVERKNQRNRNRIGYACAFINVFADSIGSLLQKRHGTGMTTWSINLIRFGFGGFILCVISALMRIRERWSMRRKRIVAAKLSKKSSIKSSSKGRMRGDLMEQQQDSSTSVVVPSCQPPPSTTPPPPPRWYELPTLTKKGWLQINAGVALVTFFSPALWNFALLRVALGLAVALGSVGPVYGLILDWPFKGQIPTFTGLVGVLLTVVGVVILCIWGT